MRFARRAHIIHVFYCGMKTDTCLQLLQLVTFMVRKYWRDKKPSTGGIILE